MQYLGTSRHWTPRRRRTNREHRHLQRRSDALRIAEVAHAAAHAAEADLSTATIRRADLSAANLSGANLSGADLSGANLSDADLSGATLTGANRFTTDPPVPGWCVADGRMVAA